MKTTHSRTTLYLASLALLAGLFPSLAHASFIIVANDNALDPRVPLNDSGEVLYKQTFSIERSDGTTPVVIVQDGGAAPGGGTFALNNPGFFEHRGQLNNSGQAAFSIVVSGASGGSSQAFRLYIGDGATTTEVARSGVTVPGGNGEFRPEHFLIATDETFNAAGQLVFQANLINTAANTVDNQGLFYWNGSSLSKIAQDNDLIGAGPARFQAPRNHRINASGEILFSSDTTGTPVLSSYALYRHVGGVNTPLIVEGTPAPDGNGVFETIGASELNDVGEILVNANVRNSTPAEDEAALYLWDSGVYTKVVREGDPGPVVGSAPFSSFSGEMNNLGDVALRVLYSDNTGPLPDVRGLALWDRGTASLTEIARAGTPIPAPAGNWLFDELGTAFINDDKEVAFFAELVDSTNPTIDTNVLYYYDARGLVEIIREGDPFLGSTILRLFPQIDFNEAGQVSFAYELNDTRNGVAVWTVPEPSTLLMVGLLAPMLIRVRRRRS